MSSNDTSTAANETLNNAIFRIKNEYYDFQFLDMLFINLVVILLIACGFWCLCASYRLKEDDKSVSESKSEAV
ncbi:Ac108 [Caenorhabditis elegans]|uniref:Ac108 n=1 Tax=Caenorhabditis elegans TaxID=6239 RepID=C1P646_CAEEL|nr:Ac108 [Caenorhabditis elegans]CAX65050.1 Ac108 [Caenorhabditis elegans]|eukprot:NP_001256284.1 Uncharacterized protein CELE_C45B11.9 [Caenorhabditis elegans]